MNKHFCRIVGLALLLAATAGAAWAGGPQYIYDYDNKIPYVWNMNHWPGGAVPYYLDRGNLGPLSETTALDLAISAWDEWNNVPSSTFQATFAGDFDTLGIGEVNRTNAGLILGQFNGGGVHVIYDSDGFVLQDWLGISRFSALGVSAVEWVGVDNNEILEAWTVLNGFRVSTTDPNGTAFRGVMTHEFGHTINLGHAAVNGATLSNTNNDQPQARDCVAPWSGTPNQNDVETMYVSIGATASGNGAAMSTPALDDIAAISNLYPAAGWPASHGSIRGIITDSKGNEITGVNVIARNVANPFVDAASYISGQVSKGLAGLDGSFELNGLTPGASYVLYVDNLLSGAYAVPRLLVLPGPEEYYNGTMESGNGETDDRCAWTEITAASGSPFTANVAFNKVKGAPVFVAPPQAGVPTDITSDGGIVVGTQGNSVFKWTLANDEFVNIGGEGTGGSPAISDDGTKIAFSARDGSGAIAPAVWENGVWTNLPLWPNAVAPCGTGANANWGSSYDISGDGSTVVGLSYANGCSQSTGSIRGFRSKAGASEQLPKYPVNPGRAGRANATNYDGSVIAGWDDANGRLGVYWTVASDGTVSPTNLVTPDISNYFVGEASDVTADGSIIIGLTAAPRVGATTQDAWTFTESGGLQTLGNFPILGARGGAAAISDDGRVITGFTDARVGFITTRFPSIWTSELGWTDLNLFMNVQGSYAQDLVIFNATAMSADGRTHTGFANSIFGQVGWVLKTPKAVMCHKNPGNPKGKAQTIDVSFPDGMSDHLAHGDTLGLCQQ